VARAEKSLSFHMYLASCQKINSRAPELIYRSFSPTGPATKGGPRAQAANFAERGWSGRSQRRSVNRAPLDMRAAELNPLQLWDNAT
jgi:hypothetical protein